MKLSDNIKILKQINTKYEVLLNKIGIFTIKDLLTYFPIKYTDSSIISTIKEMILTRDPKNTFVIDVKISDFKSNFFKGKSLQQAKLKDDTGVIKTIWFNQPFLKEVFKEDLRFLISGQLIVKPRSFEFRTKIYEPVIDGRENIHTGRIVPEYSLTEGISKKWFRNRIKNAIDLIDQIEIKDEIKDYLKFESKLNIKENIKECHFPTNSESLNLAINSLSLYELINIQIKLEQKREEAIRLTPPRIDNDYNEVIRTFIKDLPFNLTSDQLKIVNDLTVKIKNGILLNELIQGDVGSGKTIIVIILCLMFSMSGYQSIILAPTTILAKQHFKTFNSFLKNMNINIELVTSNEKNVEDKQILIGTSAILARQAKLIKKPGIIIVDEQHRFGVVQREELLKPFSDILNNDSYPHLINMTATPIPRTIAQVFFGDIEVSTIRTKPVGRLEIKTFLVEENKRKDGYKWIKDKIQKDRVQVYWVCPLVNESEIIDARSVEKVFEEISKEFKTMNVSLIHGQMKEKEKIDVMDKFSQHKIDILVSTSVIEVGIDVANATIMVIENAERFGLAQLHQMRGRVGRSEKQSWCFLFYNKDISNMAMDRLKFLSISNDGLKIAEYDLSHRGPGEIYGFKQSGIPDLKIAKLNNIELIKESRVLALKLYKKGVNNIELFT